MDFNEFFPEDAILLENLECGSGFLCVDINLEVVELFTNFTERDLTLNGCRHKFLTTKIINDTWIKYCPNYSDFCENSINIGRSAADSVRTNGDYLIFFVDLEIKHTRQWENETLVTPYNNRDTILVQTLECHFKKKGGLIATTSWLFQDAKSKKGDVQNGSGNFTVKVLVSESSDCLYPLNTEQPPDIIFICVIINNGLTTG